MNGFNRGGVAALQMTFVGLVVLILMHAGDRFAFEDGVARTLLIGLPSIFLAHGSIAFGFGGAGGLVGWSISDRFARAKEK